MYKGMYIAMTGARLRSHEMDNVANNLANVSTPGHKRTSFSSRLYPLLEGRPEEPRAIYHNARAMAHFGEYRIDMSQGAVRTTGNPLDLAVNGEGFFVVESRGNLFYTRNGTFSRDVNGFLTTLKGQRVLDTENMPIRIQGNDINISTNGTVYVDGSLAGRLKLVSIDNAQPIGDSLLSGNEIGPAMGQVLQGSIEMSNVNPVREMVGIILALRQYESARRVIQSFDQLAQRTVTEIARV